MKARITALFAVVVVALSLVAAASADTYRPADIKGWDYYAGAGSVKPWDMRSWDLKAWGLKSWGSSWSSLHPRDAYTVRGW